MIFKFINCLFGGQAMEFCPINEGEDDINKCHEVLQTYFIERSDCSSIEESDSDSRVSILSVCMIRCTTELLRDSSTSSR